MDVLGSTGWVELNLFRTQMDEERQTRALASGLRVVSASDDPSGLAISEHIQGQVLGLQQGIQNVQTAGNLLSVADGTLATVQKILSRIHSLIVEAASDLNSVSQLSGIQSEIDSLLQEVNKIASTSKFNGITLFDGSHDGSLGLYTQAQAVQLTATPNTDGTIATSDVYAQQTPGTSNPGPLMYNVFYGSPGFVPGLIEVEITGYSSNPTDPTSGTALGQPGVYVKVVQYSTSSGFNATGGATEQVYTQALPTDTGPDVGSGMPVFLGNADNSQNMLRFDLANLSQQDVGVAMAFETFDASNTSGTPTGTALQVNSTGTEGGIVSINLPQVSTNALDISGITVLPPDTVGAFNDQTGQDTSNAVAAMDAEARVQNAIEAISGARAKIGAQTVALQEDASDAAIQVVNQTASESAIRDVDMGQAVTQFTKDQVMSQIGTSVLAQMQANAQLVIELVSGINPGISGKV
ncbi:MAG TPA: flagellin [Candidatus Baltobacteraceae bacterium]|jgi:flagellin|nr:flagellin [Candidatus Baltobacteraceae bacterium]